MAESGQAGGNRMVLTSRGQAGSQGQCLPTLVETVWRSFSLSGRFVGIDLDGIPLLTGL